MTTTLSFGFFNVGANCLNKTDTAIDWQKLSKLKFSVAPRVNKLSILIKLSIISKLLRQIVSRVNMNRKSFRVF